MAFLNSVVVGSGPWRFFDILESLPQGRNTRRDLSAMLAMPARMHFLDVSTQRFYSSALVAASHTGRLMGYDFA